MANRKRRSHLGDTMSGGNKTTTDNGVDDHKASCAADVKGESCGKYAPTFVRKRRQTDRKTSTKKKKSGHRASDSCQKNTGGSLEQTTKSETVTDRQENVLIEGEMGRVAESKVRVYSTSERCATSECDVKDEAHTWRETVPSANEHSADSLIMEETDEGVRYMKINNLDNDGGREDRGSNDSDERGTDVEIGTTSRGRVEVSTDDRRTGDSSSNEKSTDKRNVNDLAEEEFSTFREEANTEEETLAKDDGTNGSSLGEDADELDQTCSENRETCVSICSVQQSDDRSYDVHHSAGEARENEASREVTEDRAEAESTVCDVSLDDLRNGKKNEADNLTNPSGLPISSQLVAGMNQKDLGQLATQEKAEQNQSTLNLAQKEQLHLVADGRELANDDVRGRNGKDADDWVKAKPSRDDVDDKVAEQRNADDRKNKRNDNYSDERPSIRKQMEEAAGMIDVERCIPACSGRDGFDVVTCLTSDDGSGTGSGVMRRSEGRLTKPNVYTNEGDHEDIAGVFNRDEDGTTEENRGMYGSCLKEGRHKEGENAVQQPNIHESTRSHESESNSQAKQLTDLDEEDRQNACLPAAINGNIKEESETGHRSSGSVEAKNNIVLDVRDCDLERNKQTNERNLTEIAECGREMIQNRVEMVQISESELNDSATNTELRGEETTSAVSKSGDVTITDHRHHHSVLETMTDHLITASEHQVIGACLSELSDVYQLDEFTDSELLQLDENLIEEKTNDKTEVCSHLADSDQENHFTAENKSAISGENKRTLFVKRKEGSSVLKSLITELESANEMLIQLRRQVVKCQERLH